MDRKTARREAQQALERLLRFEQVYRAPRRSFDGQSPIALVLSQRLEVESVARDEVNTPAGITVSLYVRCDVGDEDAAEDELDELTREAALALVTAGFTLQPSDAAPEGAPLRNIDGTFYRVERLPLRVEHYQEG